MARRRKVIGEVAMNCNRKDSSQRRAWQADCFWLADAPDGGRQLRCNKSTRGADRRAYEHVAEPVMVLIHASGGEHAGGRERDHREWRGVGSLLSLRLERLRSARASSPSHAEARRHS